MKSSMPKSLQFLHGRPLLGYIIRELDKIGVREKILVIGPDSSTVKKAFSTFKTVTQHKALGSGHAVKCTKKNLANFKGNILILCGDTPLIKADTLKKLIMKRKKTNASCAILTAQVKNPTDYGRVLRDTKGDIIRIKEEKDLSHFEKGIREINVGAYCFDKKDLFSYIDKIKINPVKKEYYLTDIIEILIRARKKITSCVCEDALEAFGINTKEDLAEAETLLRKRILKNFMNKGITIVDPLSTFIDIDTKIGQDTVIYPNTIVEKDVTIGKKCSIGPFARLRPKTTLKDKVEIGNFVELVRTKVSSGTKIKHLTYLGDTVVGKNVNIGAGTITANYDGKNKNKTIIGDNVSIGVGAILIAPLRIGRGATIGAGSVVTKDKNVQPGTTVCGVPARLLRK